MPACAMCGCALTTAPHHREITVCEHCGSTPRFCGLALAINRVVWGDTGVPLRERPRGDVTAIGISDDPNLAGVLGRKLAYVNTWFHQEPQLDICSPDLRYADLGLIVCSDVIEHTLEPPVVPLTNLYAMLRPGGRLILTAPTFRMPATIEWYGGAQEIEIDGDVVLWRNRRGELYVDNSPVFHGGFGSVLEMRLISHDELLATARAIGFMAETLEFDADRGYAWKICRHLDYIDADADARVMILTRP